VLEVACGRWKLLLALRFNYKQLPALQHLKATWRNMAQLGATWRNFAQLGATSRNFPQLPAISKLQLL